MQLTACERADFIILRPPRPSGSAIQGALSRIAGLVARWPSRRGRRRWEDNGSGEAWNFNFNNGNRNSNTVGNNNNKRASCVRPARVNDFETRGERI
ncbi:MAG: hypothetical protein ABSD20_09620 [Terriglobales bacterium]|jgi:hypothetical protein